MKDTAEQEAGIPFLVIIVLDGTVIWKDSGVLSFQSFWCGCGFSALSTFVVAVACLQSPSRLAKRCAYPHGWVWYKVQSWEWPKEFHKAEQIALAGFFFQEFQLCAWFPTLEWICWYRGQSWPGKPPIYYIYINNIYIYILYYHIYIVCWKILPIPF